MPARADRIFGTGNPTLTTGDAPDSICPSGWRLPTGDSKNGSYGYLMTNIYQPKGANLDTIILSSPLDFTRAGHYDYNGSPGYQAYDGNYWTRAYQGSVAQILRFYATGGNFGFGHLIHCLAR